MLGMIDRVLLGGDLKWLDIGCGGGNTIPPYAENRGIDGAPANYAWASGRIGESVGNTGTRMRTALKTRSIHFRDLVYTLNGCS